MRITRFIALSTLLAATAFVSSGPPWISIEYPGNPYDAESRGNYLYVHVFHHAAPIGPPVAGTAEGIVSGERRSVKLAFDRTKRSGVYSLTRQWAAEGTWTLVISARQGEGEFNTANAIVELGANGEVTSVRVPTTRKNEYTVPAPVVMADIEARLRERAAQLATR